jgi:hypothetical protein
VRAGVTVCAADSDANVSTRRRSVLLLP